MKIAAITLENWTRYRGKHRIELRPDVYSVMARLETDEDRSNWLGKTSLLYAVPFALYGRHLARVEDEWITQGEKLGAVGLELDDGTKIRRERRLGKSTQLIVTHQPNPHDKPIEAKGDDAQRIIVEKVGLSEADFFASCYFAQKQMARFITARPAERHEIISAWLDLEPLQRCEDNARQRLAGLLQSDEQHAARMAVIKGMVSEIQARFDIGEGVDIAGTLRDLLETQAESMEKLRLEAAGLQDRVNEHAARVVSAQSAAEFDRIVEQGKALGDEIRAAAPRELEKQAKAAAEVDAEAKAALNAAREALAGAKRLVSGQFDGRCPVMCGPCPVSDTVKAKVEGNARLTAAAASTERAAAIESGKAADARRMLDGRLSVLTSKASQLDALRRKAAALKPAWDEIQANGQPPDTSELAAELGRAMDERLAASKSYYGIKSSLEDVEKWFGEWGELTHARADLSGQIARHREALAILGRGGAQKRLAEFALAEIEADANALLVESGIDLSLEVRWAREAATGLARACDQCGAPFPASQRVKHCDRCKSERGPLLVEKLEVELSDRSGAAEDLAGIGFQLAAAAWLRRARGAAWSVAFLDEPFGALDEHNRRALATHLTAMLRSRYGFEQSFVVAHDRGVMDALPARIEIVGDANGSRVAA